MPCLARWASHHRGLLSWACSPSDARRLARVVILGSAGQHSNGRHHARTAERSASWMPMQRTSRDHAGEQSASSEAEPASRLGSSLWRTLLGLAAAQRAGKAAQAAGGKEHRHRVRIVCRWACLSDSSRCLKLLRASADLTTCRRP